MRSSKKAGILPTIHLWTQVATSPLLWGSHLLAHPTDFVLVSPRNYVGQFLKINLFLSPHTHSPYWFHFSGQPWLIIHWSYLLTQLPAPAPISLQCTPVMLTDFFVILICSHLRNPCCSWWMAMSPKHHTFGYFHHDIWPEFSGSHPYPCLVYVFQFISILLHVGKNLEF